MKIYVFSLIFLFPFFLTALVESTLDTKIPLDVTLSTTAPNRVMFEDGAIVDVVLDDTKFQSLLHKKTGQVFLTPNIEITERPTSITLMTSTGEAQTLSIIAKPGPSEIVVLKEKEGKSTQREPLRSDYHSSTVEFLNQILAGEVPNGYGVRTLKEEAFSITKPFHAKPLRLIEGPFEEILIVEISHICKKPQTIDTNHLRKKNDSWVFVANPYLEPREKTLGIIATKKGDL